MDINKEIFQWKPFTYLVEDFSGKIHEVGGFFPSDVRKHCDFVVKKIHGPKIVGFKSWVMHQIVS